VQIWFELEWTYASLRWLPAGPAPERADVFEQGGMWSPETLIFILHLSAILCTGILITCLVNSLPGLVMKLRRQSGLAIVALGAAAVSMAAYAVMAPGYVDVDAAVASLPSDVEYSAVAAFGMMERQRQQIIQQPVSAASGVGGKSFFDAQCIACHGVDARGIEGLGVSLVDSGFVASSSREKLIEFLKLGRMPNDPATVTGLVMPGFAWIAEEDLAALAGYVKAIAQ
jgi:mono/diheme cytochrome c family protein